MRRGLVVAAMLLTVTAVAAVPTVAADDFAEECLREDGTYWWICYGYEDDPSATGGCAGYEMETDNHEDETRVCATYDDGEVCVGPKGIDEWTVCDRPQETATQAIWATVDEVNRTMTMVDQLVENIAGEYDISNKTGIVNDTYQNASERIQNASDLPVHWYVDPCHNGGEGIYAEAGVEGTPVEAEANASDDGSWDKFDVWSCDTLNLTIVYDIWATGYEPLQSLLAPEGCPSNSEANVRSSVGELTAYAWAKVGQDDGDKVPCADAGGGADPGTAVPVNVGPSGDEDLLGIAPEPRRRQAGYDGAEVPSPDAAAASIHAGAASRQTRGPDLTSRAVTITLLGGALLGGLVAVRLYRRLRPDDVLDNDIRSRMLALIEEAPAVNAGTIAEELGIAIPTVIYHGRILAETGHLEARRDGREVVYYKPGQLDPVEKALHKVEKQETKRLILRTVRRRPGLSMADLARALDKHRSTIKHHADDLIDRGLIERTPDGRSSRIELSDDAARALHARIRA